MGLYLYLSRALPAALSLYGLPYGAIEVIQPHHDRLTALEISLDSVELEALDALLRTNMRLLERLLVTVQVDVEHIRPNGRFITPLESEGFPHLYDLRYPLRNITIASFDGRLRHLDIDRSHASDAWMVSSLLEILQRCVSLETLRIRNLPLIATHASSNRVTALPSLRHLSIAHCTCQGAPSLLSQCVLPPECLVEICCDRHPMITSYSGHLLPDVSSTSLPQVRNATAVRLIFADSQSQGYMVGSLEAHSEPPAGSSKLLSLSLAHIEFERCITGISDIFLPFKSLTTLEIHAQMGYGWWTKGSEIWTLLVGLPQLRRLSLGRRDGRPEILPMLGEPLPDGGGCLCPSLEHLEVVWRHDYGGLFAREELPESMLIRGILMFAPFCDVLEETLDHRRAALGGSAGLRGLSVRVLHTMTSIGFYRDEKVWALERVTERLRERLAGLLEDVRVSFLD
ncbi:hypothetical protein C8Q76DRAFT_732068 [Earliella scabrosa]|nr:hypothetical protein C8Q76DRAFT_732068 [Earliella scabrosa]